MLLQRLGKFGEGLAPNRIHRNLFEFSLAGGGSLSLPAEFRGISRIQLGGLSEPPKPISDFISNSAPID